MTGRVGAALPWALGEGLLSFAFTFATTMVMARLLAPEEFGQATIAIAISAIVQSVLVVGPTSAFVRTASVDSLTSDSIFWALLAAGVLAALLCVGLSFPVARIYAVPQLQGLVAAQGLSCIVLALAGVPTALLTRKLRTRSLALRTLAAKFVTLLATTAFAATGYGSWSVIWGALIGSAMAAVMLWARHPRAPRLRMSMAPVKEVFRMGSQIGVETLLGLMTVRGSLLLYGHYHGLRSLGHVNFGMRLVDEFGGVLNVMAQRTSLAYFAALRRAGADTGRAFLEGSRTVAILVAPIFAGIGAVSPTVIPLFFGPEWASSALATQVIAALWLLRFVRILAPPVLRSHGVQGSLVVNAFMGMVLSLSYLVATQALPEEWGLAAFLLPAVVSLPAGIYILRRTVGVGIGQQLRAALAPLAAASLMAAAVIYMGTQAGAMNRVLLLVCQIAAGIDVYVLALLLIDRSAVRRIVALKDYLPFARKRS